MGASYTAYLIETFVTLAIVCGLAFAVLYGARRLGLGRAKGPIELVGQLPLDARRFVYLVKVGAQIFVVAAGEGGFTKLGEVSEKDLDLGKRKEPFESVLSRVLKRPGTVASTDTEARSGDAAKAETQEAGEP